MLSNAKKFLVQWLLFELICVVFFNQVTHAAGSSSAIPSDHSVFHRLQYRMGNKIPSVLKVLQDSRGYIWLATAKGLFRHDGYGIKSFGDGQESQYRLSSRFITDIVEDQFGNLWVATKNGLNQFNLRTGEIKRYYSDPVIPLSDQCGCIISDNNIQTLFLDEKRLLVGTAKGLDAIDLQSEGGDISSVLKGYQVKNLSQDDHGDLWLVTGDNGLLRYNEASKTTQRIIFPGGKQNRNNALRKTILHKNDLWIASDSGLIQFDIQKHLFKKHLLKGVPIYDMAIEAKYGLWIATHGQGLYRYSLTKDTQAQFSFQKMDQMGLPSHIVYSLFIDRSQSRLWLGSRAGVSFLELSRPTYLIRRQLLSKPVWGLSSGQEDELLIGGDNGLNVYCIDNSTYKNYEGKGSVGDISSDDEKIWMASFNGLLELDRINHELNNRTADIPFMIDKPRKLLMDVEVKGQHELLMASQYGVIHWDKRTQKNVIYKVDDQSVSQVMGNSILEIYNIHTDWLVGARNGLYSIDFSQKKLKRYLHDERITHLDKAPVHSFAYDSDGSLWVGTLDGLFKLKDREIVAHYNKADELPNPTIRGTFVEENHLWVSSDDGIAVFQIGENLFERIHLNNEFFDMEFNQCDPLKLNDGNLYFCSEEGVFYFNPKLFVRPAAPLKTVLTDFRLFNQPQMPGSTWLPIAIDYSKQLRLDYQQSMLSFEFSALNYSQPAHLYAYQMEGITKDDEWIITDSQNRIATFTTQTPGEYTFRVKAGWDEHTWSSDITELKVIILPPWWRSNFAYLVYFFVLLFTILAIIKIRTHRLQKYATLLKYEVEDQTKEIQGLLEKKNELFANVSHELRTPLTLIIDPVKRLIEKHRDFEDKESLLLVKRNSQRLLHMVDQLLNIAKTTQTTKPEHHIANFSKIITLLIDSMQGPLHDKRIGLSFDCQDDIYVNVSAENLETIALNLLSNAIKYCNDGGEVDVSLSELDGYARLIVRDTGIGIAPENQGLIFERFKRVDHEYNQTIPGTGIGLALVKEVLDLHQGTITVNSESGQGCEFIVGIPISKLSDVEQLDDLSISTQHETLYIQETLSDPIGTVDGLQPKANYEATPRILIIEDTRDMRDYIYNILSDDYDCYTATDGGNGLNQAKECLPDLIVCDVMMPGMDGFELLQTIRNTEQTSHIPLILLTAKTGKENQLQGLNKLADDYITKPFDRDILLSRIANLLSVRKLLRDYFSQQFQHSEHPHQHYQAALIDRGDVFLQKFHHVIEENFQNSEYSVDEMASAMHMSKRSLQQKLKAVIDQSPKEYLILYRLKYAASLLRESAASIREVQEASGFSNASGFANSFKQHYRVSAREYRNQNSMAG